MTASSIPTTASAPGQILRRLLPRRVEVGPVVLVGVLHAEADLVPHPATPVFVRLLGDLRHLDVDGVVDGHGIFHVLDAIRRQLRLVHEAPGPEAGQLDEAPVRLEAGHGAPLDGVGRGGVRLSLSSAVATAAAAAVGRRRRRGAVSIGHTADRYQGTNLFGAVDLVERRQGIGIGRDRMWDVARADFDFK